MGVAISIVGLRLVVGVAHHGDDCQQVQALIDTQIAPGRLRSEAAFRILTKRSTLKL
jgi:hypothetical protein